MKSSEGTVRKFSKDEEAIRKLSPEQYRVTQQAATERPGSGEYLRRRRVRRATVRLVQQV